MLFFNTWWLTYFRPINGIVNKHFANLKCEIWIIIKAHLSAKLSIPRVDVDQGENLSGFSNEYIASLPHYFHPPKTQPTFLELQPIEDGPCNDFSGAGVHFFFYLCSFETD